MARKVLKRRKKAVPKGTDSLAAKFAKNGMPLATAERVAKKIKARRKRKKG